jgi:outer membrane beta-barrel protein
VAPSPSPPTAGTPGAPTPSEPGTPPSPSANPRAQTLVSGAPLYNPNVAVHIVERKPFSDQGKHEITLFPALAQVNGKFTQHFGTALSYTYHVHENFAFQLMPQWNWFNAESSFNRELIDKGGVEALPATSLLLNMGLVGGVEVVPLYGKFAWYENSLLQFSVVISGAAGYGTTRHELKPRTPTSGATYGDTGNRFLGSIGGGFRVQFGDRFAVRLEVRDVVYTARVDEVNGCGVSDLEVMFQNLSSTDPAQAAVSSGCRKETFSRASGGFQDVVRARELVRERSSDVLNLVSFYGGAGFLF